MQMHSRKGKQNYGATVAMVTRRSSTECIIKHLHFDTAERCTSDEQICVFYSPTVLYKFITA